MSVFAAVAIGALGAIGRGPDGSSRAPLGAAPFVAVGSLAVFVAAALALRGWTWASVEKMTASRDDGAPKVELPKVKDVSGLEDGGGSVELVIQADGSTPAPPPSGYLTTIVVVADRRATWGDVSKRIRATADRRSSTSMPKLAIRVATDVKRDRSELGRYAAFVGPPSDAIGAAMDASDYGSYGRGHQKLTPKATDDMQSVVDQMRPANAGYGDGSRIVLLPPEGSW